MVAAFAAGALAGSLNVFGQPQGKVWRIGYLGGTTSDAFPSELAALRAGLHDQGYTEGKNLVIEFRWADGKTERLPALAAELVGSRVDLMVVDGSTGNRVAQKATTTIPIVMVGVADPVGDGLVKSLGRPGGNITGLSSMSLDISPKYLELLRGMVPRLARVAVLTDPGAISHSAILQSIQNAARKIGVTLLPVSAATPQEIDKAFALMNKEKAGAMIVASSPLFVQQRGQIAALAAAQRLPAVASFPVYAEAGLLMTYGMNRTESYRYLATYVARILKGAKPADLPVEQPTRIDLVINRGTAKALGLTIPQSLLISAERVID